MEQAQKQRQKRDPREVASDVTGTTFAILNNISGYTMEVVRSRIIVNYVCRADGQKKPSVRIVLNTTIRRSWNRRRHSPCPHPFPCFRNRWNEIYWHIPLDALKTLPSCVLNTRRTSVMTDGGQCLCSQIFGSLCFYYDSTKTNKHVRPKL